MQYLAPALLAGKGEFKRGLCPFFSKLFPLSTLGEGDKGGEVDEKYRGKIRTGANLDALEIKLALGYNRAWVQPN